MELKHKAKYHIRVVRSFRIISKLSDCVNSVYISQELNISIFKI